MHVRMPPPTFLLSTLLVTLAAPSAPAQTTERVSVDSSGVEANGWSDGRSLSADGTVVAFSSAATNLVPGDTRGRIDIFVRQTRLADASWTNYGAGFPGTLGVPAFTARTGPVIGTTFTLDLGSSAGAYVPGLLFIGAARASLHSGWGGDLLVDPFLTEVIALPPPGLVLSADLPLELALMGITLDLQALELDPGAAREVSFTAGLELVLGR
jgi:hypothetical protein